MERVRALVEPVCARMGYDLVHVDYALGRGRGVLTLYIDREGAGITHTDCGALSAEVSPLLDVEDPIDVPYDLVVSSPGVNRPISRPSDFSRFSGHCVRIVLHELHHGRRKWSGVLGGLDAGDVLLTADGQLWRLPLALVRRTSLDDNDDRGGAALRGGEPARAEAMPEGATAPDRPTDNDDAEGRPQMWPPGDRGK